MKNSEGKITEPFLVAEVSSNHQQCRERALAFVEETARLGFDAVKFQQFRVRELFSPSALAANPKLLERIQWELPEALNGELSAAAHQLGLEYQSTPFYRDAVELLLPHVDRFKLASYQILWHDLLRLVASTHKPVVLATGMATLDEVRAAVDVLGENGCTDLTVLHCVSLYPTPPEEANLRAIETLRSELGLPIGWSDHTRSVETVARAVERFGAELIELHLDLDTDGVEYSGGHCWLPEEAQSLVTRLEESCALDGLQRRGAARVFPTRGPTATPADGDGIKRPRAAEQHERQWRTDPLDGLRPLLLTRKREGYDLALDPDLRSWSKAPTSVVGLADSGHSEFPEEQVA